RLHAPNGNTKDLLEDATPLAVTMRFFCVSCFFFFFQAEDGIRDFHVTGVQTCALPIFSVFPISITLSSVSLNIEHLPTGYADKRLAAVFTPDSSRDMRPRHKTSDPPKKGIDLPLPDDRHDNSFQDRKSVV